MNLEKLANIGSQLGLAGAELRKWVTEKEKEAREEDERAIQAAREEEERKAEREERTREKEFERQLQLEREKAALEEKARQAEAERERERAEREEKARQAEAERRQQEQKAEIEKLSAELQSLRSQRDSASPDHSIREENGGVRLNPSKLLVAFDERKDDLDAYIRRFEGIARSQNWPEDQWSTALSTRLTGEALSVFGRLSPEDAANYSKVKAALLKRFRFTVEGYREKFRSEAPADGETATQFAARLSHYFDRWTELAEIEKEVQDMKALQSIEESVSPYNSPVLLVKKADLTNRFVVDYRKLNNVLIADSEPMPRADAVFAAAGGKRYFSKLDFAKGYWQIPLSEESKPKTAFSTTSGLYQFRYMPFGIKTAPAVFAKLMRRIVNGIPGVHHYYDDVLIASDTWEEHRASLRELFTRIEAAGLTVRPSKCEFGAPEIDFLGHRIGQGELAPLEKILEKIQTAPTPKTKRQVRAFLGLAGYYREFIPNYAEISAPLTQLTKKGESNLVKWNATHEKAFEELKRRISSPPILRLPDFTKTFVLRTDASQTSLGAVLMQQYEGTLHPIAYASRKLLSREASYSTIERECLALVWGIQKFNAYLYGRPFIVQTDHQPLQYIQQSKQLNSRVLRWSLLLQEYQFRVEHIKGSENVGADYLSRV